MAKRFTAEERKKIIEQYEADQSCPDGYYIIKNKKGVYNIRKIKAKKEASSDPEYVPEKETSSDTEPKKKEPKPNTL